MSPEIQIIEARDPRHAELLSQGWVVAHRSWAAQAQASKLDRERLVAAVARGRAVGEVREIGSADGPAVSELDRGTLDDYPGGEATAHRAMTIDQLRSTVRRPGFGVFADDGRALAISFVEVEQSRAETDFTVVAADQRGRGLAAAVKAAAMLALLGRGVTTFRTGGSAENQAILALNTSLGFVVDEEWLTLRAPG